MDSEQLLIYYTNESKTDKVELAHLLYNLSQALVKKYNRATSTPETLDTHAKIEQISDVMAMLTDKIVDINLRTGEITFRDEGEN